MEEAPTPSSVEEKKNLKYIYSDPIEITIDNENYLLKLGKNNNYSSVIIFIESKNILNKKVFKADYSLLSLSKISKYFKIFESIEEVFDFLNNCFKNNKINFHFQPGKEKLIIEIEINNLINGKELIKIELIKNEKEISQSDVIEELKKLNEKINNMENIYFEKIKNLENENKILKEKILNIENKLIKNDDIINNINVPIINNSTIIKNFSSINFVFEHLKTHFSLSPRNKIEAKLIYRASTDGPYPKDYHTKCDNIPNTLCLIQTTKNIIFGGYANIKLCPDLYGGNRDDRNAFAFSVNLRKIYLPKNDEPSLHFNKYYGPIFGNNNNCCYIFLVDRNGNFFQKGGRSCEMKNNPYNGFLRDYEINDGEKNFGIKEIEVYQVFF